MDQKAAITMDDDKMMPGQAPSEDTEGETEAGTGDESTDKEDM